MSTHILLAAAAVLAFAAPAAAQDPAPAAPPAAAAGPSAEAEAAFEAKAEVFEGRMEEMQREMQAAVTAAAGDQVKLNTDLDAIVAKYQPEADAFAGELNVFLESQLALMPEEQRTQMTTMGPVIEAQIKGAPADMKARALQAAAAPAPAPAQ